MNKIVQPQTLKGFRDFFPEDAQKRQYAIGIVRKTFELYGFEPIETPAIEYLEIFTGNIGEDEQLFYKFKDIGGRDVALRYDQTVPTSRFVAQYSNQLNFPFKRYQIQTVWRAEKPQKGRFREFLQCDADIFGVEDPAADAETIALSIDIFKKLGFEKPVAIINDRELYQGIPYKAIVAIDKLKKIGDEGVIKELMTKGFSQDESEKLLDLVKNQKPNKRLTEIFKFLDSYDMHENYIHKPTLARSFSYSSGPIWEIVIEEFGSGSLLGGERYDHLIGRFTDKSIPATGFALGFDRTVVAMEELNLFPNMKTQVEVLVTIFAKDFLLYSQKITQKLRQNGICTDLYADPNAKLEKQLKFADKKGISFVIICGSDEVKQNKVVLKNLKARTQDKITLDEAITALQHS